MELRTSGIDSWSKTKEFESLLPSEVNELVREFFSEEKESLSCFRWYARGLRLDLAIRKVMVDQEVSVNAAKR